MDVRFLAKLATPAFKVGKFGVKTAVGGVGGRIALGSAVGAAYAGITSQSQDTTNYAHDVMRGALLGGAAGGLSRLVVPKISIQNGIPNFSGGTVWNLPLTRMAKASGRGILKSAGKGLQAATFALRYPITTAATGVGIYGLSQIGSRNSPSLNGRIRANYSTEETAMENMDQGVVPNYQMMPGYSVNSRFANSTYGLVQSLHRGRH